MEGLEGPIPKDNATPEMQRSFAEVIELIRQHNGLEEEIAAPSGVRPSTLEGFWGPSQVPKVSLGLPWSELCESVLAQVEGLVSGKDNSLKASRSTKLLPPPLSRQRYVYVPSAGAIPTLRVDPDLVRIGPGLTLEHIRKGEVFLSQVDVASLESTAMAALQAVSWLDRWSLAVSKMAASALGVADSPEKAIFGRLMLSGGRTVSFLSHQIANLWGNLVLKRRDAVLSRLNKFIDTESHLELRNGPLLGSPYLFPRDRVDAAVDRRRSGESDLLVHQAVASAPRAPRGPAAKPSGAASIPSMPARKPQSSKAARKGAQASSSVAKKVVASNFQPRASGRGSGKGKKKGGGR